MEKTWQVVAAFVGIFIAGTVTGGLLTLRVVKQVAPQRPAANANGNNGVVVEQFAPLQLRALAQQLDLTKEQRETIGPIVQRTGEALRRLRQDTQRDTRILLDRMHDGIVAVLTPDQVVKFEEIRERQRQRLLKEALERKAQNQNRAAQQPLGDRPNPPPSPGPDQPKRNDPQPAEMPQK